MKTNTGAVAKNGGTKSSKANGAALVTQYIRQAPKHAAAKLRQMRGCIKKSAPGAAESMKWSMPSFSYKRILVIYGGFKNHIGLYPTPSPIREYRKEIEKAGLDMAKGSIQFPLDQPLPLPLIKKIVAFRVREEMQKDAKWKPAKKPKK